MLRRWLGAQRRGAVAGLGATEDRLKELCAAEGWSPDCSDEEDDDDEEENSEPLVDSDIALSDSGAPHD